MCVTVTVTSRSNAHSLSSALTGSHHVQAQQVSSSTSASPGFQTCPLGRARAQQQLPGPAQDVDSDEQICSLSRE